MNEIWKPIKGYEGVYEVSSYGRVRSLARMRIDRMGRRKPIPEKMLKMHDRKGYDSVTLQDMGRKAIMSVHRLVAMAFIPNPDNLPVINHRDENPKNNQVATSNGVTSVTTPDMVRVSRERKPSTSIIGKPLSN